MKNCGEAIFLGAHLIFLRCAPLLRTLIFLGALLRCAPKFPQVRTLAFLEALQGLCREGVAMLISPRGKGRSECV